ncbi:MAG: P1 family peptidase [Oscillospiraceae bacterium]
MGLKKPLLGWAKGHSGPLNSIADVPGVRVGHCTLHKGDIHTGVSAILPHSGNLFLQKLPAAAHVINGFGKTTGLVQLQELGTLETPIFLTNTLSVGTAYTACVRHMLAQNPCIGTTTGTVNPIIAECNDGEVSDIRALAVTEAHANAALAAAGTAVQEGSVGAGAGMVCYGLKGGIGTASRLVAANGAEYALGCLVLSNFGNLANLSIGGQAVGEKLLALRQELKQAAARSQQGSIIVVLATNAPLSSRQLGRLCRRAGVGMARTGAYIAGGSGEIALAFSTQNPVPHFGAGQLVEQRVLHEDLLDAFFAATGQVVEEAILSSLYHAPTLVGRSGPCFGLRQLLQQAQIPE